MKNILFILFQFLFIVGYSQIELPLTNNYIEYTYYSVSYDEVKKCPIWSAYSYTISDTAKKVNRYSKYLRDKSIEFQATNKDYYKSGYDRGHLSPAANFRFNLIASKEINYYTNITPQYYSFNRGIWKKLENQVRKWAYDYDTLYIISGPILIGGLSTIGNGVIVPDFYYKAIIAVKDSEYYSIAFLIPNIKSDVSIFNYCVSIDFIETLIILDLFYKLPDNIEIIIEKTNTIHYDKVI